MKSLWNLGNKTFDALKPKLLMFLCRGLFQIYFVVVFSLSTYSFYLCGNLFWMQISENHSMLSDIWFIVNIIATYILAVATFLTYKLAGKRRKFIWLLIVFIPCEIVQGLSFFTFVYLYAFGNKIWSDVSIVLLFITIALAAYRNTVNHALLIYHGMENIERALKQITLIKVSVSVIILISTTMSTFFLSQPHWSIMIFQGIAVSADVLMSQTIGWSFFCLYEKYYYLCVTYQIIFPVSIVISIVRPMLLVFGIILNMCLVEPCLRDNNVGITDSEEAVLLNAIWPLIFHTNTFIVLRDLTLKCLVEYELDLSDIDYSKIKHPIYDRIPIFIQNIKCGKVGDKVDSSQENITVSMTEIQDQSVIAAESVKTLDDEDTFPFIDSD